MFNILFNGALIQQLDCAYMDQMSSMIAAKLHDTQPKKRLAYSEDIFIQATACITCNWENTYKHRGLVLICASADMILFIDALFRFQ
jgi:hypothetical protein